MFRLLLAVLRGLFTVTAGIFLLAGLMLLADIPAQFQRTSADVLWAIGGFSAGRCAGFHARRKGILTGMLCGIALCAVLLCGCALLEQYSAHIPIRCTIILLASVCGGILGVNRKITGAPD